MSENFIKDSIEVIKDLQSQLSEAKAEIERLKTEKATLARHIDGKQGLFIPPTESMQILRFGAIYEQNAELKAENERLQKELPKLAIESVEREKSLAKLEAEVESFKSQDWVSLEVYQKRVQKCETLKKELGIIKVENELLKLDNIGQCEEIERLKNFIADFETFSRTEDVSDTGKIIDFGLKAYDLRLKMNIHPSPTEQENKKLKIENADLKQKPIEILNELKTHKSSADFGKLMTWQIEEIFAKHGITLEGEK